MNRDNRVISFKRLPARLPLVHGITVWLLLDRFAAPQWAMGVFWTLAVILGLLGLCLIAVQKQVDPLEGKP